jgi:hypothetical protein
LAELFRGARRARGSAGARWARVYDPAREHCAGSEQPGTAETHANRKELGAKAAQTGLGIRLKRRSWEARLTERRRRLQSRTGMSLPSIVAKNEVHPAAGRTGLAPVLLFLSGCEYGSAWVSGYTLRGSTHLLI